MKVNLSGITLLFLAFISLTQLTFADPKKAAAELAQIAVSNDVSEAKSAVSELREMGTGGLEAMFTAHAGAIKAFISSGQKTPEWLKVAAALDAVAMQKDSYASHLYWHTDLERAKAEAQKSGKPILSLRLLGNLNEELSCANSRFFRSALYPNAQISQLLQEKFILHWQSVRPAPKVTIDFGDGRKMETTLTGNSIHYVLDSKGNVIDALPGLYGPQIFYQLLDGAQAAHSNIRSASDKDRASALSRYYRDRLQRIDWTWTRDLRQANVELKRPEKRTESAALPVAAVTAAPLAVSKSIVEVPVLPVAIMKERLSEIEKQTDLEQWKAIASAHRKEAVLDENSRTFIARKLGIKGEQFDKLIRQFEENLALDTVRNVYLFQPTMIGWLDGGLNNDLNKLNEKVYAELFLTPSTDPWLGLYTPETFNGIENAGISK